MGLEQTDALATRARRAYERARVGVGLESACWAAPAILLALWAGASPWTVLLAPGVVLLAVGMAWRGGPAGRAVVPGLVAGALPVLVRIGCGCCALKDVAQATLVAALLGGLVAGVVVSSLGLWLHRSRRELLYASALAVLTGSMGCALFSVGEVVGLAAGLALGAMPLALRASRPVSTGG